MAAFGTRKFMVTANKPVETAAFTPVSAEHKEVFYRFYSKDSEIFWSFIYPPSDKCLNMTCRMLKFPNYEEIDEIDYKKGYRH